MVLRRGTVHFDTGQLEESSLELLQRSSFMTKQSVKFLIYFYNSRRIDILLD